MNNKILGYILMGAGLVLFVLSYSAFRTMLKLPPFPAAIKDVYILVGSVALLLAGAFLTFGRSTPKQPSEVPIYEGHGKERRIVAIQRMGKK